MSLARRDRRAAAMIEYALLIGLIAVVAVASVGVLGTAVRTKFGAVATAI